jgi:hypothetical protein
MNKEFIPYEQALELKELGFDEPCFAWFGPTGIFNDWDTTETIAPLYQQAFRWFRKNYNYDIVVSGSYNLGKKYYYRIETPPTIGFQAFEEDFNTYEEAELACLIKLIKICKEFIHQ